ncbi:MAG: hypothetical protein LBT22_06025 [Peptococcaceae bacterium]|nr:hypothetical protein [Peptococcaceae bacterium]
MNNEEKILAVLEKMGEDISAFKQEVNQRFDAVDQRFDAVDQRFDAVDQRLDALEKSLEEVKEDLAEVRSGTNHLLDWAERSEKIIKVPLMTKK